MYLTGLTSTIPVPTISRFKTVEKKLAHLKELLYLEDNWGQHKLKKAVTCKLFFIQFSTVPFYRGLVSLIGRYVTLLVTLSLTVQLTFQLIHGHIPVSWKRLSWHPHDCCAHLEPLCVQASALGAFYIYCGHKCGTDQAIQLYSWPIKLRNRAYTVHQGYMH
jgi:hypothetical protein